MNQIPDACGVGQLALDDPSEGRYVCDSCTGTVFFDDGTGQIVEPHVYKRQRLHKDL